MGEWSRRWDLLSLRKKCAVGCLGASLLLGVVACLLLAQGPGTASLALLPVVVLNTYAAMLPFADIEPCGQLLRKVTVDCTAIMNGIGYGVMALGPRASW